MDMPLRLGRSDEFARARAVFERAGFVEERICRGLGIPNLAQVGRLAPPREGLPDALGSEALALLVRVFVFTQLVPREEAEGALEANDLAALLALDLLRRQQGAYYSPAFVYPVAGFVIASDRHDSPDGSDIVLASDVVFPALDAGTLRFLALIPRSPAQDALDLCSGTGVAAMVMGRSAARAVAADITPRSAHFARFNVQLNACPNVEIALGDLYEPVAGQTFDRIVAHPPYVPALDQSRIFRDGGTTGESILRRIIADLPRYLRPGGTLYCVVAAWDATEGPLESRIRRWLGEPEHEFDVIFAQQEHVAPERLASWLAEKAGEPDLRARWEEEFRAAGLEQNVYGAVVVHRADTVAGGTGRAPVTARVQLSPATDGACFEWALHWYPWRAEQQATGRLAPALLGASLRLGSRLRARVTYAPRKGRSASARFCSRQIARSARGRGSSHGCSGCCRGLARGVRARTSTGRRGAPGSCPRGSRPKTS